MINYMYKKNECTIGLNNQRWVGFPAGDPTEIGCYIRD